MHLNQVAAVDLGYHFFEEIGHFDPFFLVAEVACESSELLLPLDEVGLEALACKVEGCGHTCYASAYDCGDLLDRDVGAYEGLEENGLGDGHLDEVLGLLGGRFGALHVNPGALVTDVCHVAEVLVEPSVLACLPEEGLVGPGRARGDDDPVEVLRLYSLGYRLQGVLCTCVSDICRVDYSGQVRGEFRNRLDVHCSCDVGSAVADPYAHAGLFSCDVLLLGVLLGGAGREILAHDVLPCLGGRAAGLGDRGGDVLGGREGSCDKYSLLGGLEGAVDAGLAESVFVELDSEHVCEFFGSFRRYESDGQDGHVVYFGPSVVVRVGEVYQDLLGDRVLLEVGHAGPPDHSDLILVFGPVDVVFEFFSVGPYVHEVDVFLYVGYVLLGEHRLLGSVHAAHRGAVFLPSVLLGPGSAALDECYPLGRFAAGGHDDVSAAAAGSTHVPLELHSGYDIGYPAVSVFRRDGRVPDLESVGGDYGPDVEDDLFVLVVIVDGALLARLLAEAALSLLYHPAVLSIDDGDPGDGLGVRYVYRFPLGEPELEIVGKVLHGTLGDTVSAACALVGVDVSCFLLDCYFEVARFTVNLHYLVVSEHRDVRVARTVRHFRGQDASGTVVRRESLVETGHLSADGGFLLHQIDVNASVCKIQRSLYTCDPSSYN